MDHPHSTWWSLYWLSWILYFLVPELIWLWVNPINTLSEQVWSFEHLNMAQPFDFGMWSVTHWAVSIIVWLLFAWLSVHLPFGLLR